MFGWLNRRLVRKHVKLLWQNSMALLVMGNAYGVPVSEGQKMPNRSYERKDTRTEQWLRAAISEHNRMRDAFYDNDVPRPLSRDDPERAIDINNGLRALYDNTITVRVIGKSFDECYEPVLSWQDIYENHGVV